MTVGDLDRIFKAYDVRGVVPDDLDEDLARRIGAAFAEFSGGPKIVIGRDCRLSSPDLAAAISEGVTSRGAGVVDLGLASTDLLYFASGSLDLPAVMITASHNPKQYNGLKFCLSGARPVGVESGLLEIRAMTETGLPPTGEPGLVEHRDLLPAYIEHVLTFLDASTHAAAHGGHRHRERDGGSRRSGGPGATPGQAAPPLPGARRDVPEPSRRPDRPGESARPAGRGPAARGGHRPRVRRRRRPRVPDRREGPGRERVDRDGARRQGHARARARRQHHLQRHLLVDRAGGDPSRTVASRCGRASVTRSSNR